jgi:hypothetical protein
MLHPSEKRRVYGPDSQEVHFRASEGFAKGVLPGGYWIDQQSRRLWESVIPPFFLLKEYRCNPDEFSLTYHRETPTRIPAWVEDEIEKELMSQKNLLDDSTLPITTYNYSVIRDRLAKQGIMVALSTIMDRVKCLDCYQTHRRKKVHDQ